MADVKVSNRQAICNVLMELAERDRHIVVLTSDSMGSASLAPFVKNFPEQHVEVGIAEQNIVGVAAGLASMGKKPIVASPASFLSMRAADQIKVDVAYSHMPVLLYGISGGLSYGALGMTHHSLQDIALMSAIPGIDVILPADRFESQAAVRELMKNPRPAYLRIGRNPVKDVYESEQDCAYEPSKATIVRQGDDACIIATGEMVYPAMQASVELAKEGIQVRVLSMHTVKPMDVAAVLTAAETGFVVTMEEHSIYGGLGSTVCRILSKTPVAVHVIAVPDEPVIAGKSAQVFEHYGMTADHVMQVIRDRLK